MVKQSEVKKEDNFKQKIFSSNYGIFEDHMVIHC